MKRQDTLEINIIKWMTLSDKDLWLHPTDDECKTELGKKMTDTYNVCRATISIYNDLDLISVEPKLYSKVSDAIYNMKTDVFYSKEIEDVVKKFKKETREVALTYAHDDLPDTVRKEKALYEIVSFTNEKCGVNNFVEIDTVAYAKRYARYKHIPDLEKIRQKRADGSMIEELEQRYARETDFEARCIYAIELSYAYHMKGIYDEIYGYNPAVPILESLMDEQKYSIYICKMWMLWRNRLQACRGSSKYSWIANDEYDMMRLKCAHTLLKHIVSHPKDCIAICSFVLLSSTPDILRHGTQYGNQNMIDTDSLVSN